MWHLINPRLDDFISKKTVGIFLNELAYIAIDMNVSKIFIWVELFRYSERLWWY